MRWSLQLKYLIRQMKTEFSFRTLVLQVHIASYKSYTWKCVISSCPSKKTYTLSQTAFLKQYLCNGKYAKHNVPWLK